MFSQIKAAGARRYVDKSVNFSRYVELGQQILLANAGGKTDIKMNFDILQKSDAKIIGHLINDFQIMECIQLWSDVIDIQRLHRRDKLVVLPPKEQQEFSQTKISQSIIDNVQFYKCLADHASTSLKIQIIHLVGQKICK